MRGALKRRGIVGELRTPLRTDAEPADAYREAAGRVAETDSAERILGDLELAERAAGTGYAEALRIEADPTT